MISATFTNILCMMLERNFEKILKYILIHTYYIHVFYYNDNMYAVYSILLKIFSDLGNFFEVRYQKYTCSIII